jgi:hypothetical protein
MKQRSLCNRGGMAGSTPGTFGTLMLSPTVKWAKPLRCSGTMGRQLTGYHKYLFLNNI